MARNFNAKDANRLIKEHLLLKEKLQKVMGASDELREDIKKAANAYVTEQALVILKGVPIEELNRNKTGIKVKALRDHGYNTIADISTASVFQIASIYGISEDAAYTIHRIVHDIVQRTLSSTKIRISIDSKTASSTKLIALISIYKNIEPLENKCTQLYKNNERFVTYAIEDLSSATSGLRWFFSSSKTKKRIETAYNTLYSLFTGNYAKESYEIINTIETSMTTSSGNAWKDFQENSVQFFNILEDIVPGILGNDDVLFGLPEDLARAVQDEAFFPEGLLCSLRRYQEWGVKYILHQEKVLLGDEMGLGKTVQAIASMVSLKNTGATHFIVVCPASVISNWCREITNKSKLRVTKIHGSGIIAAKNSWIDTGGVAVTTFETTGKIELNNSFRFSLLIVDEAHYIKNPDAARSKNVKTLCNHASRFLFMTGTALENKVGEMVSLIKILQPTIAMQVQGMEFLSSAPQFRKIVAPVYYRRKREDVLTELPELIESKEWCSLLPEEERAYENAVLSKQYSDARRVSWNIDNLKYSSKAKRMMEIINEATDDGRKIIVFSFFLDTIRKIIELLGDRCLNPISGSVPPIRRQEILDEFENAPEGTVLAAQIQSGGTGLNIQSASVVIFCEPQLKPSIENQAISRAYRMGQTRNVLVYRLLCENTVDEKILSMLEKKQEIFNAFADKSEAAQESIELDSKTFGNIIKEEIDRINEKNKKENQK